MAHPFNITAKNKTTGEVTRASGEFTADEWASVLKYLDCVGRLTRCRMAESRAQLSWGMSWQGGDSIEYRASFPPEDDMWAFLHCMRPFVLKETSSFYHVRKVFARRISVDAVRGHLDGLKAVYNGSAMGFSIEYNGSRLTSDEAVDLWLNAFEYHQDADKRTELAALFEIFPEPAARALFLGMMLQRASAVQQLAEFAERLKVKDGVERSLGVVL